MSCRILTPQARAALRSAGISRRGFIKGAGALVVGFSAGGAGGVRILSSAAQRLDGASSNQLDSWIAIAPDGAVTAYTGKCELGQGLMTAQMQLVAEELSVPIGRVKLMGAMLSAMELHLNNRVAVLYFDQDLLDSCSAALDDTEGLVNLPLGAVDVQAVVLFKRQAPGVYRASLRSKGAVDVRAIAAKWDGGGHKNAAGLTLKGDYQQLKAQILNEIDKVLP